MKGYYREDYADRYLAVLFNEIASYGKGPYQTIYVGGGTPSVLNLRQTKTLLDVLAPMLEKGGEFTFEGNPESIDEEKARLYAAYGVNRVSLGVESFSPRLLRLMGRRHTADDVFKAVSALRKAGIGNLNLDLIYGLPGQTLDEWDDDLVRALALPVCHLSAYALIYEEGTALWQMRQRGEVREADDELSLAMFERLMDRAAAAGFDHYEISNFARPGWRARHNSSYWTGAPYVGCGPGAHSFDGRSTRRRNLPDLAAYTALSPRVPMEEEHLTPDEQFNDCVMTALRTADGLSLDAVAARFGAAARAEVEHTARRHLSGGRLCLEGGVLRLTRRGLFVSDDVMSDFMRV